MTQIDPDCFDVVQQSIDDERPVDNTTHASLAVLEERLQRLKNLDNRFRQVDFSPAIKKMLNRKTALAIG